MEAYQKCVGMGGGGGGEILTEKKPNPVPNELSWLYYNIPTKRNIIFFIVKSSL